MKYFVTGATGFIGGRVARRLVEAGHQVSTVARTPSRAEGLARLGVHVYEGDITNGESLRTPMTGVDGIFHIAGWYKIGVADTTPGQHVNVDGTRNVLQVMRDLEIPKGVYTSSLAVFSDTHGQVPDESYRYDGPHLTEYDRTKWEAHYGVALPMMEAGLPLVIVQPGVVYGPGDTSLVHHTFAEYVRGRLRATPRGTSYCWAHVDDIVHGHIRAMEEGKPGESYIIAGEVRTVADTIALAEEITEIPAPRVHPSPGMLKATIPLLGLLNRFWLLPEMYTPEGIRSIAGATYLGSNAKARRELGLRMRPLEEGLPETLAWEMEQAGMAVPARMRGTA